MPRILLLVFAALLVAPALHAQAVDSVRHLPAAALRKAVAAAPGEQPRTLDARMMVHAGAYTIIALRRTADGEAEVHAEWDDVMVIQDGTATLLSGGEVSGARQTALGELRGGRINGGTRRTLAPGDVVTVPAGVPHQMLVGAGDFITYLVVKVRRAGGPPPVTNGASSCAEPRCARGKHLDTRDRLWRICCAAVATVAGKNACYILWIV